MNTVIKDAVLDTMASLVKSNRDAIKAVNKIDVDNFAQEDLALYDRLKVDDAKVDGMIKSLEEVRSLPDPVGKTLYEFTAPNGLRIYNKSASFGTVLIVYESRPDVTIEAAAIAFKAGNKILLKGGKESIESNLLLVKYWQEALALHGVDTDYVRYLNYNRQETMQFLTSPTEPIDLIVPRGGDQLINFVKEHASCPVIVSGRGNNFLYVAEDADWPKTLSVIMNGKTSKISVCNALDKVLLHPVWITQADKMNELSTALKSKNVTIYSNINTLPDAESYTGDSLLKEEFLDYKILIEVVANLDQAIAIINKYSGGHSATIMTQTKDSADKFMQEVDCAAVYQNASTRFTDGGQMGMGAELAISTDKLHQRGPLGLPHLVTNKWFVYGDGQTR
jgi:glutamate-5-semialdehyde dehydrogenase